MSNAIILAQLLLQYTAKAQEIAQLFQAANGGDVTDEQVDASGVKVDFALAKLGQKLGA